MGVLQEYKGSVPPRDPDMPAKVPPLSDLRCRSAKADPAGKPHKLFDGGGLFLLISPTGTKHWRFKYRFAGKEKLLSLGPYPSVSLADARELRDQARQQLRASIDPAVARRIRQIEATTSASNTMEAIGREWHQKQSSGWATSHADKVLIRLEKNVFPVLGALPIQSITTPALLSTLQTIERRGALDTARRIRQYMVQIFRHAIQTGRAERNPAADLVGATAVPISHKYASIRDPQLLGRLVADLDVYEGSNITRAALQLLPMLFCRPGELRGMRWTELDMDARLWRIPPERQKLRKRTKQSNRVADFIVPLPKQAVEVLQGLAPYTKGYGEFVFPSERSRDRPMSDGTFSAALRRLGYDSSIITPHGFRHTASTMLNESRRWSADAIEAQLSHADPNSVRGIYNGAKYLKEREQMMQAWADHLDRLKRQPCRRKASMARADQDADL